MNKSSYTKLFLTLALGLNLLGGCQFSQESQPQNNTSATGQANQVNPPEKPNQEQLKKRVEEIDRAYKTYLESQNKFIESFNQEGFNQKTMRDSVNTKDSSEKLSQLNQAITQLKIEIAPLQTTQSNTISNIISDIEKLIQDLSDQVISPLKNGLTDAEVGKVQVSLEILPKEFTSAQGKGKFGPDTIPGVENFLSAKSQNISEKISQLKQAINPTSSTTSNSQGTSSSNLQKLELEFNSFKVEANERAKQQDSRIFLWICIQLIMMALFISLLLIWLRLNKTPGRNHGNQITSEVSSQELESQVPYGYQELEAKYNNLENQLKELNRLYQNLSQYIVNPSQSSQSSQSTEHKGISDLYYLDQSPRHSSPKTTGSNPKSPLNQPQSPLTNTNLNSIESHLIQEYNSNHKALLKEVIEVNIREDSLNKNRLGSSQPIALEPKKNGSYWVAQSGGVYYLIPKYKLGLNQYNFETIQYLFNCEGYSSNFQGFKVKKPAQVYSTDGGGKWQVSQLGILEFY
jgi:hypothetical protein